MWGVRFCMGVVVYTNKYITCTLIINAIACRIQSDYVICVWLMCVYVCFRETSTRTTPLTLEHVSTRSSRLSPDARTHTHTHNKHPTLRRYSVSLALSAALLRRLLRVNVAHVLDDDDDNDDDA